MRDNQWCIGIPTINRADLLSVAMEHYSMRFWDRHILIINNGPQEVNTAGHGNCVVVNNSVNRGVAGSWNDMAEIAFTTYESILILNDDVIFGRFDLDERVLSAQMARSRESESLMVSKSGFCSFVLHDHTFDRLGRFDEDFYPAYYEDNDYVRRAALSGVKVEVSDLIEPWSKRFSSSISKDPSLNSSFEANKSLYIAKWGGLPGSESFLTPYNR